MALISGKLVGSTKKPKKNKFALYGTKEERITYFLGLGRIPMANYSNMVKKVKPIEGELTDLQKMALDRQKRHEQKLKNGVKRMNDPVVLSLIKWAMGCNEELDDEHSNSSHQFPDETVHFVYSDILKNKELDDEQ